MLEITNRYHGGSQLSLLGSKLIVEVRGRAGRRAKERRTKMEGQLTLALALAIPVILFPVAFVWYLNLGWVISHVKEAVQERKAAQMKKGREAVALAR